LLIETAVGRYAARISTGRLEFAKRERECGRHAFLLALLAETGARLCRWLRGCRRGSSGPFFSRAFEHRVAKLGDFPFSVTPSLRATRIFRAFKGFACFEREARNRRRERCRYSLGRPGSSWIWSLATAFVGFSSRVMSARAWRGEVGSDSAESADPSRFRFKTSARGCCRRGGRRGLGGGDHHARSFFVHRLHLDSKNWRASLNVRASSASR